MFSIVTRDFEGPRVLGAKEPEIYAALLFGLQGPDRVLGSDLKQEPRQRFLCSSTSSRPTLASVLPNSESTLLNGGIGSPRLEG